MAYQAPPSVLDVFRLGTGERWQAKPLIDPTGDAPAGPMASHAGRRLMPEEVRASLEAYMDQDLPIEDQDLARIWVFELPELINREFSTERAGDLYPALGDLLASSLAIECSLGEPFGRELAKYGLLDVTVPAPPLSPADVPMVIAVCAEVVLIGEASDERRPALDRLERPG